MTLVHKGNIMKFTEGAFRDWGYELAAEEFREQIVTERESWILDNQTRTRISRIEAKRRDDRAGPGAGDRSVPQSDLRRSETVLDAIYATHGNGQWKKKILINDRIADSVFQQVLHARR